MKTNKLVRDLTEIRLPHLFERMWRGGGVKMEN